MSLRKNPYKRGLESLIKNIASEYPRIQSRPIEAITVTNAGYDIAVGLSGDSIGAVFNHTARNADTFFNKYIDNIANTAKVIETIIIEDFESDIQSFTVKFEKDAVDQIKGTKDTIEIITSDPSIFYTKKSCQFVCLQAINSYIEAINEFSSAKKPTDQLMFDFEFFKVPIKEMAASEIKTRVNAQRFNSLRTSMFSWNTSEGLKATDIYGEDVQTNRVLLATNEIIAEVSDWIESLVNTQGCNNPISSYIEDLGQTFTELSIIIDSAVLEDPIRDDIGQLINRSQVDSILSSVFEIEEIVDKVALLQIVTSFWFEEIDFLLEICDESELDQLTETKIGLGKVIGKITDFANQIQKSFKKTPQSAFERSPIEFTKILEDLSEYFKTQIAIVNQKIRSITSRSVASIEKRESLEFIKTKISDAYRSLLENKSSADDISETLESHVENLDSDPSIEFDFCIAEAEQSAPRVPPPKVTYVAFEQMLFDLIDNALNGRSVWEPTLEAWREDEIFQLENYLSNIISDDSFKITSRGEIEYTVDSVDFQGIEIPQTIAPKHRMAFIRDIEGFEALKESINEQNLKRLIRYFVNTVFTEPAVDQFLTKNTPIDWTDDSLKEFTIDYFSEPLFFDTKDIIIVEEPTLPPKPIEPIQPPKPIEPIQPPKPIEPIQPPKPIEPIRPPKPIQPPKPTEPPKPSMSPKPLGLTISFNQQGVKRSSPLTTNIPFLDFYNFVNRMQRNISSLFTFYLIDTTDVDFEVSLMDGISNVNIQEDIPNSKIEILLPSHFDFKDRPTIEFVYLELAKYLATLLQDVEFDEDPNSQDGLDAFEIFQLFNV